MPASILCTAAEAIEQVSLPQCVLVAVGTNRTSTHIRYPVANGGKADNIGSI
jgi:hypothetical protein